MAKDKPKKKDKKVSDDATNGESPYQTFVDEAQGVDSTVIEEKNVETTEASTENKEDETPTEEQKEEVVVEEKKVKKVEPIVVVDEIEELIKPQTEEENRLVKLMQEYKTLSEIPQDKVKISDFELKVKKLCEIIYLPHQVNVKNPSYLYSDIEKFFTKYRKTILSESFAIKYSYAIGNKQRFNNCITIYTILITLVDCKLNKKPFTLNIETAAKMLGVPFESFISWITDRASKFK